MHKLYKKPLIAIVVSLIGMVQLCANNLVIGGKNFTEQLILSSMTQQYLQAKGYKVSLKNGLGGTIMRQALENKQLDIVWDYTGTALTVYNKVKGKFDQKESYQRVKKMDEKKELIWLNPSKLNNTFALAMPREFAKREELKSIGDLAKKINQLHQKNASKRYLFGADFEFVARPDDGLAPMQLQYGFNLEHRELKQMDPGLVFTALRNNQLSVGLIYSSDGRISAFDLILLTDNERFFPFYSAVPIVRKDVLDSNPKLAKQLNVLSASINTEKMREMNKKVDINQLPVDRVAADFLRAESII